MSGWGWGPAVKAARNCSSADVTPVRPSESIEAIIAVLAWLHQSKPALDGPAPAGRCEGRGDNGGRRLLRLGPGLALLPPFAPASPPLLRALPPHPPAPPPGPPTPPPRVAPPVGAFPLPLPAP